MKFTDNEEIAFSCGAIALGILILYGGSYGFHMLFPHSEVWWFIVTAFLLTLVMCFGLLCLIVGVTALFTLGDRYD